LESIYECSGETGIECAFLELDRHIYLLAKKISGCLVRLVLFATIWILRTSEGNEIVVAAVAAAGVRDRAGELGMDRSSSYEGRI